MTATQRLFTTLAACGCIAASSAFAAGPTWEVGGATVRPILSDRLRVELVDWFDPGDGRDADYAFVANALRFGASIARGPVEVTVEGQEVGIFDLPDDSAGLGPGAAYFASTRDRTQRELHLRQAWLAWRIAALPGFSVRGGRFIFNDGLETQAVDPSLAWIKKMRVSQRLLGAFEFTHVGRSFDGGVAQWQRGTWNATVAGGLPTAGGFNISANKHIDDIYVVYGALTATEADWLPRSDARLFYLHYADGRDLVATDNRGIDVRRADDDDIRIHTVGANFARITPLAGGELDVLVWVAGQFGEWESLDHRAWALAIEGGYRRPDLPGKPWLRVGWFRGSGDDDPADGDHDTFFEALPTARLYAQTPFFNLMNNQDTFVQLLLAPWSGGTLRIDYHHLRVADDDDLVYAGGGATQSEAVFGFGGFPARGRGVVANLVDVSVTQVISAHAKVSLYYGHAFGGGAVEASFSGGDDLDYGFLEMTLSL